MDTDQEIREFLTTRRARLTPERAGLPTYGRARRVAGLRREEGALLAGTHDFRSNHLVTVFTLEKPNI